MVPTIWYLLLAPPAPLPGFATGASSTPSSPKLSFAMSARGLPLDFFGAGAFFALGGVSASNESSSSSASSSMPMSEFSSSESSLRFFLGGAFAGFAALGLAVAPAGRPRGFAGAAAFFGAAFALVTLAGFAGGAKSELAPSSKTESSIRESSIVNTGQLQSPARRRREEKKERAQMCTN
jgi:hypothetical protein